MAKTKTPFLSLGSQGTLGNVITSQKGSSSSILRSKPTPSDRRTLPQIYQRWLYEDYAYLWRQQSEATRRAYAAAGVRFHLTGFQYWMKYQLTNLPDIAALYHLDEISGATARDSSRNANHGFIFGASPATLIINGAYHFDGINDVVSIVDAPSLRVTGDLTIEAFGTLSADHSLNTIFYKHYSYEYDFSVFPTAGVYKLRFLHGDGAWEASNSNVIPLIVDRTHHFAVVRTLSPKTLTFYFDGQPYGSVAYTKTILPSAFPPLIGYRGAGYLWDGILDHLIIYNRPLDSTEILRHSLRRYSP